jgi:prepilin peptidase CpaA
VERKTWRRGKILELFIFLCLAAVSDLRDGRIGNRLVLAGAVTGLILQVTAYGPTGVLRGILQAAVLFILLWPVYLLSGLGAGDCKMLMMCALFFREPENLVLFIANGFVIAAVMGLCKVLALGRSEGRKIRFALPVCIAQLATVVALMGN